MRLTILIVAVLVAACGGGAASPSAATRTLTGTFILSNGEAPEREAGACAGTGGYDDVRDGLDVVVRDASGTIVGTGALATDPEGPEPAGSGAYQCGYRFRVSNLPDAEFYEVAVGSRGEQTYSRAELDAAGWDLALELGG